MGPLVIGANEWGEAVEVASPLRSAHVLGVPAMGKSTLIGQLAVAYAERGCDVLVLDIKDGALAHEIVTRGRLPLERMLFFAPGTAFAQGRTWALNPLVGPASVVPDNIIDMLKRAGDLQEQFTQLKEHLEMGLELSVRQPQPPTLHTLVKLLTDPAMRESMMTAPHQPERLLTWWEDFHRQGVKGGGTSQRQRDAVSSTIVRLDPWLVKEPLATLLDHPANTLQVGAELDAGTLIVCDLVSGVSSRQTMRLGNLLMALLINAALDRDRRRVRPASRRFLPQLAGQAAGGRALHRGRPSEPEPDSVRAGELLCQRADQALLSSLRAGCALAQTALPRHQRPLEQFAAAPGGGPRRGRGRGGALLAGRGARLGGGRDRRLAGAG